MTYNVFSGTLNPSQSINQPLVGWHQERYPARQESSLTTYPRFIRKANVKLVLVCVRSRLGCQVIVTKEMNEFEVSVPGGTADARG